MTMPLDTNVDLLRSVDVCTALNVPLDDQVLFWRWADELPSPTAADELNAYLDVLIAQRCRRPGDDEVSRLIAMDLTADAIRSRVTAMVAPRPT